MCLTRSNRPISSDNVSTMMILRKQKNASHTNWTTGEILEPDHPREGTFTCGMEQAETFDYVRVTYIL